MPTVGTPLLLTAFLDLLQNELRNAVIQNLGADPGAPIDGQIWYRSDLDEVRVRINGATQTLATGATGIPGTTFNAKGDLIVGTGDDAYAILTVGADGTLPFADSAETTGIEWRAIADTDIPGTIARDSEVTAAISASEAGQVRDGDAAGGVLGGTYPNPGFAVDMATQAELDAHVNDATDAHDASAISYSPSGDISSTDVQAAVLEALADAKAYADSIASGLKLHASVALVEIATSLDLNGSETIDGVVTPNGARVLLTAQADADDNGIWLVNTAGAWTRPTDFDAAGDVVEGAFVFVEEGTTYEGTGWVLAELAGAFGSFTQQTWTQFSGAGEIVAGAALTKTGNQLDVQTDGTTIIITADELHIGTGAAGNGLTGGGPDTALAVGAGTGILSNANDVAIDPAVVVRKFAQSIGDGAASSFVVNHALNTRDVTVAVYLNSGTFEEIIVDVQHTDVNNVTVVFTGLVPALNAYRVVVHG